ncbi:MAG: DUF1015 domain-containing protein [Jatrophihabitans sp.]|uniref:DUF1015 domain-containing protein n=1 Tax=Jatrophihabitans sp. TaxID=1932789 RepID=UPI0039108CA1
MGEPADQDSPGGLSLAPFRGLRPRVDDTRLGDLLSPPYDVIDADQRSRLLAQDPDNVVAVVLPDPTPDGYAEAAERLNAWVDQGLYATDDEPALYVYELSGPDGHVTRGLMGAVELRAAEDGVILPHENTMAGPVADRLEVMTATGTDLEPIYLVYDGGGPASALLRTVDSHHPVAEARTPDGVKHRLWRVTEPEALDTVAGDLATRRALIADGHHRYATYQERQRRRRATDGAGPWDRGLALLVDSSEYGPQVHAIHRVIGGLPLADAVTALEGWAAAEAVQTSPSDTLAAVDEFRGFAAVLTDGTSVYIVADTDRLLAGAAARAGDADALTDLDVTVLHRGLVERVWQLTDDESTVGYAHSVDDALRQATAAGGIAVLLRPTPVSAVAAVAAAGARMPRKSTLFTPKPASGLVMRRLADQPG